MGLVGLGMGEDIQACKGSAEDEGGCIIQFSGDRPLHRASRHTENCSESRERARRQTIHSERLGCATRALGVARVAFNSWALRPMERVRQGVWR